MKWTDGPHYAHDDMKAMAITYARISICNITYMIDREINLNIQSDIQLYFNKNIMIYVCISDADQ